MKQQPEQKIGTVQAVLVAEHTGIIIPVHSVARDSKERVSFSGDLVFSESMVTHLKTVIVLLVDSILDQLNVMKPSWAITIHIPTAVASSNQGLQITGHSFDLPFFLSLLSSALRLPIRQEILYTGALFSSNGEIGFVESLAEKAHAARGNSTISGFCYPNPDSDTSLKQLKPNAYRDAIGQLRACRGRITLIETETITDVLEKTCTEKALLTASMKAGYYGAEVGTPETTIETAVHILTKEPRQRLLHVLKELIIEKQPDRIQELITRIVDFHIDRERYPSGIGNDLNTLFGSFPPALITSSVPSPLIDHESMATLERLATPVDKLDMTLLKQINTSRERNHDLPHTNYQDKKSSSSVELLLNHILEEVNSDRLDHDISLPIDMAREQFYLESTTVESYDELIQVLSRFYRHMYNQRHYDQPIPDEQRITTEAIALAQIAYAQPHSFEELVRNARKGTNGGLRTILDTLTDHLKEEAKKNRLLKVFNEAIDPLDHEQKTELMKLLMERYKNTIPLDFRAEQTEYYTEHLEQIVQIILEAQKPLFDTFRKL